MNISIMIGGNDNVCCSEIKSIIQSYPSDASILDVCCSGSELLKQIPAKEPDVVICDAALSDISCFEIMQRVSIICQHSPNFIIYGGRDFDSVYKSLKFGAIDYILQPISPDNLKIALDKVSALHSLTRNDSASRLFYVDDKGMKSLDKKELPVQQINQMYGTNFIDGQFRMIFIKYDSMQSFDRLNIDNPAMLNKTGDQIHRTFEDICADIICTQKSDGIMAVLNYPNDASSLVEMRIQELYKRICRIARISKDIDVTICVSTEITDPCNVWQIKEQVRDSEWARMVAGTNKVIFWKRSPASNNYEAIKKINQIASNVRGALESLNTELFRSAMNDFYGLPEEILLSREARTTFKSILYMAFEMYWDTIAKFADPTDTYDEIGYAMHLCTTFPRHKDVMISQYSNLIQRIAEQVEKKYPLPISNAIHFINNNIDKPISLQLVADAIHLSPGYLSHLFKKETGLNFAKFVIRQKNSYSCELLCRTDLTISEIAFRTGFPDVQSFSKQFRATNDMTPSRYRKLHAQDTRNSF